MVHVLTPGRDRQTRPRLTARQRARAQRQLDQLAAANPLRTIRLECHGPIRDALAQVGDHVWCATCGEHARVASVRE